MIAEDLALLRDGLSRLMRDNGISVVAAVVEAPEVVDVAPVVPQPNAAVPSLPDAPLAVRTYTVEAGDSVRTIATQFGVTNETIIWENDLTDPDILQVGQELHILPFSGLIHEVRPGDTVEVAPKTKEHLRVKGSVAAAETRGFPEWIEVNAKEMKGTFKALPARSDLPSTINESLVVELYSR